MTQIRIGLVGAGPWAGMLHGPMFAASPDFDLVGVWARRPEAAEKLAHRNETLAISTYEELLQGCDAVAFAVPPNVQAEMAVTAARQGKHLLLEKPLALTVDAARQLAEAVAAEGVISQIVLTFRYMPTVREFITAAAEFVPFGARCVSISGALLERSPFATPWRLEHGALLDIGPHLLDLLDAAVGPIIEVEGKGDPLRFLALTCEHENGAVSQAGISISTPVEPSVWRCEIFGGAGRLAITWPSDEYPIAVETITREFAHAIRSGEPHPLDAARGLYLQELIERANPQRGRL